MFIALIHGEQNDLCKDVPDLRGEYYCHIKLPFHPILKRSNDVHLVIQAAKVNSSLDLYDDLESIFEYNSNTTFDIIDLNIMSSKLGDLDYGLPSQFNGKLEKLSLIGTQIDLPSAFEKIRKSSAIVSALKMLHVYDVKLNEIPENLFKNMSRLTNLYLINVGLETINEKSFQPLADSLDYVELFNNQINSIPKALVVLKKVKYIYIYNNPIDINGTETGQIIDQLSPTVTSLGITMKDCSCDLARTPFFKAYKAKNLGGIFCNIPRSLVRKQIKKLTEKDLCPAE